MKFLLGLILCLCTLLISSANAQVITSPNDVNAKSSNASIKFETTSHSFGNIIEGQIARYDFKFINTGTEPLILSNVSASCGCTTPKWPREALAPENQQSLLLNTTAKDVLALLPKAFL